MNGQRTSSSETRDLHYCSGGELTGITVVSEHAIAEHYANGNNYDRVITTNGKRKKYRSKFEVPISLVIHNEENIHLRKIVAVQKGTSTPALQPISNYESVDGVLSFFEVDEKLANLLFLKNGCETKG